MPTEPPLTALDVPSHSNAIKRSEEPEDGAESVASPGAGATGTLDGTDEDFTREQARATGFVGNMSEIAWLQRLCKENKWDHIYSDPQGNEKQQWMMFMTTAC